MNDLRKAAKMALELLDKSWGAGDKITANEWHKTQNALRQALAQPEQEPEWIEDGFGTMWQKCGKKDCGKFVVKIGKVDCWNGDCPETTAPPKREWVGLTDEEKGWCAATTYEETVARTEAKLKEKNS